MEVFRMASVEKDEGSQCSSGCESGWTMYLDQSDEKPASVVHERKCAFDEEEEGQAQEEDLSMVSDASSGPPHYHDEDMLCCCNHRGLGENNTCLCSASSLSSPALATKGGKRRRIDAETRQQQQKQGGEEDSRGLLDDTASSPFLNLPKKDVDMMTTASNPSLGDGAMDNSYGFSATHLKGNQLYRRS